MRNKYFSFSTGNVMFDFENFSYYDFPNITIDCDMFTLCGIDRAWDIEFRECNPISLTMRNGKFDIGEIYTAIDELTFKQLRVIASELPKNGALVPSVRIGKKQTLVTDLTHMLYMMVTKLAEIEREMRKYEKWNYSRQVEKAVSKFIYVE